MSYQQVTDRSKGRRLNAGGVTLVTDATETGIRTAYELWPDGTKSGSRRRLLIGGAGMRCDWPSVPPQRPYFIRSVRDLQVHSLRRGMKARGDVCPPEHHGEAKPFTASGSLRRHDHIFSQAESYPQMFAALTLPGPDNDVVLTLQPRAARIGPPTSLSPAYVALRDRLTQGRSGMAHT